MKAGFCKVVITPPLGQVAFAGYNGRGTLPRGVLDDLCARALVFQPSPDPATWVVIMTTDLFMLRRQFVEQVRALATQLTGISGANMCIHAIHSHQGPDTLGIYFPGHDFDGRFLDDAWMNHLARQLAGVIYGATKHAFECRIGFGEAKLEGHTINRREESLFTRPASHQRTIDPRIPIIRVDDLRGNHRVLVTGFATHPTFLSTFEQWGAELVPYVERACKRSLGANVEIMYFTSQAGDIVPVLPRKREEKQLIINPKRDLKPNQVSIILSERQSKTAIEIEIPQVQQLAKKFHLGTVEEFIEGFYQDLGADAFMEGESLIVTGNITLRKVAEALAKYVSYRTSVRNVKNYARIFAGQIARVFSTIETAPDVDVRIDQELADIYIDDEDMAEQFEVLIARGNSGRSPDGRITVQTEVQGIKIGEAYICCWPAEPVNEIGLRLKELIKNQGGAGPVFFWELCNDGFGYLLTPFEWDAQGYEATVFSFGRDNGSILEQASLRVASRLLGRKITWEDVPLPVYRPAPSTKTIQRLKDEFLASQQNS
ncbi:MAG TPA: neutral/alkaline non-lysosomal ceramidase N-terminal domain-containing protein [Candidatus Lokiarchaeia archaeon]|nr:neutral/alkaline non-lysosomal ceramidase N-terminal domain-containing protein [Candidatus Lokiarchaeia archaeon]